MKEYITLLLDGDGFEIGSGPLVTNLKDAKGHAKYLLTDEYARAAETTHEAMGTAKVEVRVNGECIWDAFR